jgi:hypothetical protein
MTLANNKYKLRKENGLWDAPDRNEEKIMALQAELKNVKQLHKRKPSRTPQNASKGKDPKSSGTEKPTWMGKAPSSDKLKEPRMWKDKLWYYCHKDTGGQCFGAWRVHKPSECKGRAHTFNKEKPDKRKHESSNNDKRSLKLAKAYEAESHDINDSDDE